jgi:hypothetical protein
MDEESDAKAKIEGGHRAKFKVDGCHEIYG